MDEDTTAATLERQRRGELRKMLRRLLYLWIPLSGLTWLFYSGGNDLEDRLVILGMAALLGAPVTYIIVRGGPNRWRRRVAETHFPARAREAGFDSYAYSGGAFALDAFEEVGLLPGHHGGTRTHVVSGSFGAAQARVCDVVLRRTHDDHSRCVFRGSVIDISLPGQGHPEVRVTPVGGPISALMERVKAQGMQTIDVPELRPTLEARAEDPNAVAGPAYTELFRCLIELARLGDLRAAVHDDRLLIAVETDQDLLPVPSVWRPIDVRMNGEARARLRQIADSARRVGEAFQQPTRAQS